MTISSTIISRTVALGFLLAVAFGLWGTVVLPLRAQHEALMRSADQFEVLLLRYRRIADERANLQDQLKRSEHASADASGFLGGVSPDLVTAELQDQIKQTIGASGATLTSMRVLSPEEEGDHLRLAVRVNLECETSALGELFHGIEAAVPFLFLDNIDVRVTRKRKRGQGTSAAGSLFVRFDAYGYMRGAGT